MKDNTKKKAPKVIPPNKKKPNYMREADQIKGKSLSGKPPMAPLTKKRLSK